MSVEKPSSDPADADSLSIRYDGNDEQTLVVFDGSSISGVIALDRDVDADEAVDLVDSVEAEIGHAVPGLRASRRTIATKTNDHE